jgi:hypothetical protein
MHLVLPTVMTLITLADVRLIGHLSVGHFIVHCTNPLS